MPTGKDRQCHGLVFGLRLALVRLVVYAGLEYRLILLGHVFWGDGVTSIPRE